MAEPIFTPAEVLSRVRLITANGTYPEASVLLWLTDAIIELYTQAPKSRQNVDTSAMYEFAKVTSASQTIPCSAKYFPLLIDYVVARAFMQDADSMEHRARAAEHFKLFFDRAHLIEYGLPAKQTQAPISGART